MQPTSPDTWKPKPNYLLVAVPERFTYAHTPGVKRLVLPSGSDDWQALGAQLKAGINVQIETDEQPIPVCTGTVLAVPERLTDEMHLCAGPFTRRVPELRTVIVNGKSKLGPDGRPILVPTGREIDQPISRTAADITQRVEVGDTIHFDPYALNDASEVTPGVYLVGYVDVIAVVVPPTMTESGMCITMRDGKPWYHFLNDLALKRGFEANKHLPTIRPIGGYVLLRRVWANDVTDEEVEGRTHKVRKGALGLIDVIDVPPLPNEGIVAYHSSPLRGTRQECLPGDRVVVDGRHVRAEKIEGEEYLAVRQDFVVAVRQTTNSLESRIDAALTNSGIDEVLTQMDKDFFSFAESRCYVGPSGVRLLTDEEHAELDNDLVIKFTVSDGSGESKEITAKRSDIERQQEILRQKELGVMPPWLIAFFNDHARLKRNDPA